MVAALARSLAGWGFSLLPDPAPLETREPACLNGARPSQSAVSFGRGVWASDGGVRVLVIVGGNVWGDRKQVMLKKGLRCFSTTVSPQSESPHLSLREVGFTKADIIGPSKTIGSDAQPSSRRQRWSRPLTLRFNQGAYLDRVLTLGDLDPRSSRQRPPTWRYPTPGTAFLALSPRSPRWSSCAVSDVSGRP